jgi:hypothetical protein
VPGGFYMYDTHIESRHRFLKVMTAAIYDLSKITVCNVLWAADREKSLFQEVTYSVFLVKSYQIFEDVKSSQPKTWSDAFGKISTLSVLRKLLMLLKEYLKILTLIFSPS